MTAKEVAQLIAKAADETYSFGHSREDYAEVDAKLESALEIFCRCANVDQNELDA